MYSDVVDLRDFYATSLGQVAIRMIRRRIRLIWPDVSGMRLLGMGYAVPYLRPFREEAERALAVMPSLQGVLSWPAEGPNVVALAEEAELPFDHCDPVPPPRPPRQQKPESTRLNSSHQIIPYSSFFLKKKK